jgi:hypothetical protein
VITSTRSIAEILRSRTPEAEILDRIRSVAREVVQAGRDAGLGDEAIRSLACRVSLDAVDRHHRLYCWCKCNDEEDDHSSCGHRTTIDDPSDPVVVIERCIYALDEWIGNGEAIVSTIRGFHDAVDRAIRTTRRSVLPVKGGRS